MHHPPVVSGIDWMDPAPDEDWIANFAEAVKGHEDAIQSIHCGHLHRRVTAPFNNIISSVCGSSKWAVFGVLEVVRPTTAAAVSVFIAGRSGGARGRVDAPVMTAPGPVSSAATSGRSGRPAPRATAGRRCDPGRQLRTARGGVTRCRATPRRPSPRRLTQPPGGGDRPPSAPC